MKEKSEIFRCGPGSFNVRDVADFYEFGSGFDVKLDDGRVITLSREDWARLEKAILEVEGLN